MTKIECPMITCKHISEVKGDHGICTAESIWLKWRFAGNFGHGNICAMECLELDTEYENKTN